MQKKYHLIDLYDLSVESLREIINSAIALKKEYKLGIKNNLLQNNSLALIFDKNSTRTRISFECAINQLGGKTIFLTTEQTQLARGESIEDTAKVISSMVDFIALRISSHNDIKLFADNSKKPIINGLSDDCHPCQILADIMTYKELRGDITNKKVAWLGDISNVCLTYIQAAKIFDFKLYIACPKEKIPHKKLAKYDSNYFQISQNTEITCDNTDLIVTDVWTSMGNTPLNININNAVFKPYQVTTKLISLAKENVLFMHCLPAHRDYEVQAEVIDGDKSVVWQEAENRLHIQKAVLLYLHNINKN